MIFLTGIILAIVWSIGVPFASSPWASGIGILTLVDIPIFIVVVLIPFLFVSALFGFKEMVLAFSVSFKKEPSKDKLIQALNFFKIYGKTTWIAGLIFTLIGLIAILRDFDYSIVFVNMSVTLLSLLYCGIINVLIIIPFTVFIKKQLQQ
jgi:hypothetical protein